MYNSIISIKEFPIKKIQQGPYSFGDIVFFLVTYWKNYLYT